MKRTVLAAVVEQHMETQLRKHRKRFQPLPSILRSTMRCNNHSIGHRSSNQPSAKNRPIGSRKFDIFKGKTKISLRILNFMHIQM